MKQPNTAYLAGPMTGYAQCNIPTFEQATRDLRGQGIEVINPVELDPEDTYKASIASNTGHINYKTIGDDSKGRIMGRDISELIDHADTVVLLKGWEESQGAMMECFVALLESKAFAEFDISKKICTPLNTADVCLAVQCAALRCL